MNIHSSLTRLDFLVIGIYVVALLSLGFWVSFRKKHTSDLFLAGRSLGWANIGLSIFGTNVNPTFMIASCGIAYSSGMVGSNFEWLAWPFLLLLAMVFVPHYLNTKISTMPEFMDRRYGKAARVFLSWYTIFSTLVTWLGMTLFAGGLLLGQILNWPLWLAIVVLTAIATSFTVAGGLAAVVITDSFQSILMIVASAALTIIGLWKVGGIGSMVDSVPADYWKLFRPVNDPVYPWPAIVLGYPIMGIWFWCTDQTIVQRVLGARDIRQGQLGSVFAGFLKIITPFIFFMPGILCKVLHPDLADPNKAYMTMVTNYLPAGMVGLIVAVLIAALVSTVDSGLNSLSTVFTLDIYCKKFRPDATAKEVIWIGRVVTIVGGVLAIFVSLAVGAVKGMNLFEIFQAILAFIAPSMSVVFLVGVLWKRATATAAMATLVIGNLVSIGIGILYLIHWPSETFWPHSMLLAFYLFVTLTVFMIVVSLLTGEPPAEHTLPSIKAAYVQLQNHSVKTVWSWWFVLAVIMITIYLVFN